MKRWQFNWDWTRLLLLAALAAPQAAFAQQASPGDRSATETFGTTVAPFLKTYCLGCHGAAKQNADRRFDRLSLDFTKPQNG